MIVDSDIVFLRNVNFKTSDNKQLFSYSDENTLDYFYHLKRFFPELKKQYADKSGIVHHMIFDIDVLNHLFNIIESKYKILFWKAIISCIDSANSWHAGFSEYELYFNFIFQYFPERCQLRQLIRLNPVTSYEGFYIILNKSLLNTIDIQFDTIIDSCININYDLIELHSYIFG